MPRGCAEAQGRLAEIGEKLEGCCCRRIPQPSQQDARAQQVIDLEDSEHGTDFASDTQSSAPAKKGSQCQVQTVFSVDAIHRIFSTFNKEKRQIVESIGFSGLLKLYPQVKFPRQLVLWLLRNMDPETGHISLRNGEKLHITQHDVELVLGIPRTNREVQCSSPASEVDVANVRNILMLVHREDLTMEWIQTILLRDYGGQMSAKEIQGFKAAVLLYADAYFMAPKGWKIRVNQKIFKTVANISCIQEMNWCGYVLQILLQSAGRVQKSLLSSNKTITLDGCLFFLVVT